MSFETALQAQNAQIKQNINHIHDNEIKGMPLDKFIFDKIMGRADPIYYCENVLRAHLPEKRRHLHENQIELINAVCNPFQRRVAALMARQAGKTESIASCGGYLCDNYAQMRIGIFTPRIDQAKVSIGRISTFYQMNENKLNNEIVTCKSDKIELSNGSYVQAVSGSDQSNIEGLTFDVIILDEAQKISDYTWSERIVPMGGACVKEDTLITLSNGIKQTIKQIVEEHTIKELPCLNTDTGKIENHKVIGFHKVGIKKSVKLTLENGFTLEGSEIHPVLKDVNGHPQWEQLQKLNVGDRVAILKQDNYFGDICSKKIVKIEYNECMMYDLTVDKYHNYIANNIITHNTNAKMIKIGTPKTRNHFYKSFQVDPDNPKGNWTCVKRDWTQCPQLWALDKTMLPDPVTGIIRPYSTYVLSLMPKILKQEMFPHNPEMWFEGGMSVEDFKTQYMLEFIDGAGKFFGQDDIDRMRSGQFNWLQHGVIGERYFAGIDFAGSGAASADFTHITVVRENPNGVKNKVFAYEMHGVPYPEQMRVIDNMFNNYNARFKVERIFADYTGVGRPVIDSLIYDYGITNLTGITFNGRDTFTNSGMNLKNVMFAQMRKDVENGKFLYPDKEHYIQSAGADNVPFYHKMIGEWADLEQETRTTVNKIIEAPVGQHDDVCCADILANFATIVNTNRQMPKASTGHYSRLR